MNRIFGSGPSPGIGTNGTQIYAANPGLDLVLILNICVYPCPNIYGPVI